MKTARQEVKTRRWKIIAWDGVRVAVPGDWEPARIGRRYLLLQSDPGAVMEIKWAAVKGRFSGRRQLRQLRRQVRRKGAIFRETALPETWRTSVVGFEADSFQWDAGSERATGLLLRCATCRTVSLIQFIERPGSPPLTGDAARLLASFRDHRNDGRIAWALYDIVAVLPDHFVMKRHRFEAGRFVLQFEGGGRRLTLYRWAPAEVLLQDRTLADFAKTSAGETEWVFRSSKVHGHPAVDGDHPMPIGLLGRLRTGLGIAGFRRLRLWRVSESNRILGIQLEGRRPIEEAEIQAVSDGYGMADKRPFGIDLEPP